MAGRMHWCLNAAMDTMHHVVQGSSCGDYCRIVFFFKMVNVFLLPAGLLL